MSVRHDVRGRDRVVGSIMGQSPKAKNKRKNRRQRSKSDVTLLASLTSEKTNETIEKSQSDKSQTKITFGLRRKSKDENASNDDPISWKLSKTSLLRHSLRSRSSAKSAGGSSHDLDNVLSDYSVQSDAPSRSRRETKPAIMQRVTKKLGRKHDKNSSATSHEFDDYLYGRSGRSKSTSNLSDSHHLTDSIIKLKYDFD